MWVIYWGAQTWICALVGIAWLPYALALLIWAYRDPRFVVPAALATALACVSGWPYTIVALTVATTVGLGVDGILRRRLRAAARVVLAAGLGAALALPALLPLWDYLAESTRLRGGLPGELQADLETLLAAGVPVFPDVWRVFGGTERVTWSPPMQYASWFIPAVLANADWGRLGRSRTPHGLILALLVIAFGAMSTFAAGWHFRMPFRLLPDYHIALAILSAWLVTQARSSAGGIQVWRLRLTLGVAAVPFALALLHQASLGMTITAFMALTAVLIVSCRWAQVRGWRSWPVVLIIGHVVIFIALTAAIPENGMVAHWAPPSRVPEPASTDDSTRQITLFRPIGPNAAFGERRRPDVAFWSEIGPGNTALFSGRETINGYSAVQPKGFQDTLCFDYMGASCPDVSARLFAREPTTGLPLIDLLRVDRVVAQTGPLADDFTRLAGADWRRVEVNEHSQVFARSRPLPSLPRRLSVAGADLSIAPVRSTANRDTYRVAPHHETERLVWARPWYPGLRVSLNGRELPVRPLLRLLPSVELPAGEGGKLVVSYVPDGLVPGVAAASAAALLLMLHEIVRRHRPFRLRPLARPKLAVS
jgi:hypothetical protein